MPTAMRCPTGSYGSDGLMSTSFQHSVQHNVRWYCRTKEPEGNMNLGATGAHSRSFILDITGLLKYPTEIFSDLKRERFKSGFTKKPTYGTGKWLHELRLYVLPGKLFHDFIGLGRNGRIICGNVPGKGPQKANKFIKQKPSRGYIMLGGVDGVEQTSIAGNM